MEHLMRAAQEYLAPGGLLVVLGDTESGIHHQAVQVVQQTPKLKPLKLTAEDKPVLFTYTKRPWGPFDVLPPTGRLMSAWRHMR